MRLALFYIFAIFIQNSCTVENREQFKIKVVYDYIEKYINQIKFDKRLYNAPPPPELEDSVQTGIKTNSFVYKLEPLKIYIQNEIDFDKNFKPPKNILNNYDFVKVKSKTLAKPIVLDVEYLVKKQGLILIKTTEQDFYENLYNSIRNNSDYGGLISFRNLCFSEDNKQAYFEVTNYKGPLNAQTNAVYATFEKGEWIFKLQLLSVS